MQAEPLRACPPPASPQTVSAAGRVRSRPSSVLDKGSQHVSALPDPKSPGSGRTLSVSPGLARRAQQAPQTQGIITEARPLGLAPPPGGWPLTTPQVLVPDSHLQLSCPHPGGPTLPYSPPGRPHTPRHTGPALLPRPAQHSPPGSSAPAFAQAVSAILAQLPYLGLGPGSPSRLSIPGPRGSLTADSPTRCPGSGTQRGCPSRSGCQRTCHSSHMCWTCHCCTCGGSLCQPRSPLARHPGQALATSYGAPTKPLPQCWGDP